LNIADKLKIMAKNGRTVVLSKEEKTELKKKIATYVNTKEFCEMNDIPQPLLTYPLLTGRCSARTYVKLTYAKQKNEFE